MGFGRAKEPKGARIEVRLSEADKALIEGYAGECLIGVSEFVRRRALGKRIVPKVDQRAVAELRRQGGLLKHLLSGVDGQRDKQLALAVVSSIREIVAVIDKSIAGTDDDRGDR